MMMMTNEAKPGAVWYPWWRSLLFPCLRPHPLSREGIPVHQDGHASDYNDAGDDDSGMDHKVVLIFMTTTMMMMTRPQDVDV